MNYLLLLLMSIFQMACGGKHPELKTVPSVDLEKYSGKWYETASFPQRFQRGCQCTSATYTVQEEGHVVVENRCRRGPAGSKESYIKGKAFVTPGSNNAKLKVQFFWPFRGKYWIIALADDYRYAMVGHPNRDYLWILSRTPVMAEEDYSLLVQKAKDSGFDVSRLVRTVQEEGR